MNRKTKTEASRIPPLPLSRPPLERMLRIHQQLASKSYPNATKLARKLEVSTKTIHRDLDFMRDRMELPIEYDGAKFGYFYYEEVNAFPSLQITEGELVAMLIAEKALEQYRGTSFERPLVSALKKISESLPDTISFNLADWEQTISFRTTVEPIIDLEIFDSIAKATARHQQLRIEYRKPGRKQIEKRVVNPYHFANINGEWFLFAFDLMREDVRTFVPGRIKSLAPTGESFAPPKKFSLEQRLRDSFGVHSAEGEFDVVIHFNQLVADYIREKRWHPSQKLSERPDGELEMCLKLSSLGEVQRWIMTWGGNAVAIKPKELVESVSSAAKGLLAAHGD